MDEREEGSAGADLGPEAALPRGRHGLPPDVVERHQRERVAAAVAGVLVEEGYGAATVERLHSEAGISRKTFYQYFANRQEAVIAAYDLYFERFCEELSRRCAKAPDQPARVREALAVAFELADEDPARANLLLGSPLGADPALATQVFDNHQRVVELVCRKETIADLPELVPAALVGAVAQLLTQRLRGDEAPSRGELEEVVLVFLRSVVDA